MFKQETYLEIIINYLLKYYNYCIVYTLTLFRYIV